MTDAQILVNSNKGKQPICVYRCRRERIHLFYGYVNISMCVTCFMKLAHSIYQVHNKLEQGTVDAEHITVNYASTTLVLPKGDFCLLSHSIAYAQERLEFIEDCDISGIAPPQDELDSITDTQLPSLPQVQYTPQHIHLN